MLAFTTDGKTLVATNRGSDSVSIFELTASDPLFPGAWNGRRRSCTYARHLRKSISVPMDTKRGPAAGTAYEIGIVDLTQKKMTASS